jgi:hypothetical protein
LENESLNLSSFSKADRINSKIIDEKKQEILR